MVLVTFVAMVNKLQICAHKTAVPTIDPDKRDVSISLEELRTLKKFINDHYIGVDKEPTCMELCMYSSTVSITCSDI